MRRLALGAILLASALAGGLLLERELGVVPRLRAWLTGPPALEVKPPAPAETAVEHALKHLDPRYVCPMHPQIVRSEPGNCPICGMELVRVAAEPPGSGQTPVVQIAPEIVSSLGVRTASVERKPLSRRIDTVGYVSYDEDRIAHIHLRTEGWIERLLVKAEGERVRSGQLLLEVYSPALVGAQEELVQALSSGSSALVRASRERLLGLGVSSQQIHRLEQTRQVEQRVRVYAPQDGVVAELKVREGMFIKPAVEIMSLVDLGSVWVLAEVFERQAEWVRVGQPAEAQLTFLPGRVWQGSVDYVYPELDPVTRTLRVRLRFLNPDEALKPNMYAHVTIFGGGDAETLVVPNEALIRGARRSRVILDLGAGRFQAREVVPGIESGDRVEILSGLQEGDRVVVSAQFLIDSESNLKASLQRMEAPTPETKESRAQTRGAVEGTGTLREVRPAQRQVRLEHDPIPELGWPTMTMELGVAETVELQGLSRGQRVRFDLTRAADGYVIERLEPLPSVRPSQ